MTTSKVIFLFVELFMAAFELIYLYIVASKIIHFCDVTLKMNMKLHQKIALQAFLSIVTTVLGPMAASVVGDSNCFKDALTTRETITSEYPFIFCGKFDENNVCNYYVSVPFFTNYQPAFIYNGNCSNAIFINFIPIKMMTFTITGLFFPFLYMIAMKYPLYKRLPRAIAGNFPGVFWPDAYAEFNSVLRIENLLSSFVSHLATLITFGCISPPLAITIVVAMYSENICWQILIWRFVKQCLDNRLTRGLMKLEAECKDTWRTPKHTIWSMLSLCSLFYTFICFDMGFDDWRRDPSHAYIWTALLAILIIPFMYCCIHATRAMKMKTSLHDSSKSSGVIELNQNPMHT